MYRTNSQLICEKLSFKHLQRTQYGKILLHLRAMNGFVGLPLARERTPEIFVLKKQFQNSKAVCVDHVVGLVVRIVSPNCALCNAKKIAYLGNFFICILDKMIFFIYPALVLLNHQRQCTGDVCTCLYLKILFPKW